MMAKKIRASRVVKHGFALFSFHFLIYSLTKITAHGGIIGLWDNNFLTKKKNSLPPQSSDCKSSVYKK